MKNSIYIILGMILLTGCRHKEPPVERIMITPEEISCGCTGGEFPITIECSDSWEIQNSLDWADIVKLDDGSALAIINENKSYARRGKLLFSSSGGDAELVIEQAAPDVFSIEYNSHEISYKGSIFSINIKTFAPWVTTTDTDWISTDLDSSEKAGTVTVSVEANKGRNERFGTIYFIQNSDTLKVEIKQAALPFIDLASESVDIDGDGGIFDILFLSNSSVNVNTENEWIRIIRLSSGNVVSFEVLRNQSSAREGSIKVSIESDEDIFKTIKIVQGEKVPHPNIKFEEGTQMSIIDDASFKLHPIYEDMTDNELVWTSSDLSIADVDMDGNINIHKTGLCTITAKNIFHDVEASIILDIKLKAEGISIMFGNQDVFEVPVSSRFVGEQIPIAITPIPSYAYSDDFTFFSSNPEVAEFVNNTLHCLKSGKTDIYIESLFNNLKYTFTVFVIDFEN